MRATAFAARGPAHEPRREHARDCGERVGARDSTLGLAAQAGVDDRLRAALGRRDEPATIRSSFRAAG
jgi:hypothetical protein